MAESFVKTIKRDYVAFMSKPDVLTALQNLETTFEHYNEQAMIEGGRKWLRRPNKL